MADGPISAYTANTTPATTDILAIVDDPAGTPATQKITLSDLLKVINGLTEDTAPDLSSDFLVTYDTSASAPKKIKPSRIVTSSGYATDGQLLNGKISVTVASNNLTVSILTLTGTAPSTTDIVYVRIGNTIRSITSALSVTKNAGTNWCNSGSTELATKEIDYFVYIGYNATDGVTIGFSRIPFGTLYGDFSTTATNEKYCAISTITNAASTDAYLNVGRFAATLSAGAGYTWSVPTYTNKNLLQYPVFRTRRLSFASQVSASVGSITTVGTVSSTYEVVDNRLIVVPNITITTNGTGSGVIQATMPFSPTVAIETGIGKEFVNTGKALLLSVVSTNVMRIQFYDATYPGANGAQFTGYFSAFLD